VTDWVIELRRRLRAQSVVVRVAVAQARGSTPREAGAVMLVDAHAIHGTIGGGELEWRAEQFARGMLEDAAAVIRTERWPLGPELGQCCGGSVTLWFERFSPADDPFLSDVEQRLLRGEPGWLHSRADGQQVSRQWLTEPLAVSGPAELVERLARPDMTVWLFGAGHVGRALAGVLETLPVALSVVDSRQALLAEFSGGRAQRVLASDPAAVVSHAPPGSIVIIMTHSHELDYAICRAALARTDLAWVGLIGSETKATCFRLRLSREGVDDARVASLVSPIGIPGVHSKLPAAIAVSVAAQLLQLMRHEH